MLVDRPEEPVWGPFALAGIGDLLPTSVGLDELVRHLDDLASGRPTMPDETRARLVQTWRQAQAEVRAATERLRLLTPRELAVLGLLYEGQTVLTIAERTGVSEQTVRSQVKAVLRKLSVSSQLAAVAVYRRAGDWRGRGPGTGP